MYLGIGLQREVAQLCGLLTFRLQRLCRPRGNLQSQSLRRRRYASDRLESVLKMRNRP